MVELLVVIAIISLISSLVLASIRTARERARDAKRILDMNQITKALELYYHENGQYPGSTASYGESNCSGWDSSSVDGDGDGNPFIDPLQTSGFMRFVSVDPINTPGCGGYEYRYYRYSAGSYNCDPSRGAYYVLGVLDMETSGRPHPDSPGWRCPSRNWQNEFDWVAGGFEK